MFCRARHLVLSAAIVLTPCVTFAQIQWQPTAPPLVTAENATWFQSGEPIDWNGDVYFPAGAIQPFNPYQMVRSGSYRGIPLYTDTTLEPYSLVFVPLAGGRMQPYERPRTGTLAGTAGSRAPSRPIQVSTETPAAGIVQAPAPPTLGPSYEIVSVPPMGAAGTPAVTISGGTQPAIVGTGGSPTQPVAVGTSGRTAASAPVRPATTVIPPTGANTIWINFDGQRWYAAGKAIEYDASILEEIGTYHGWTVYRRTGDSSVIYVPSMPGLLSPYKRR